MPLTRTTEDPLYSTEESLRRVALLQLTSHPTLEGARSAVRAMLHFMSSSPALAEEFSSALARPPLSLVAEPALRELLDHAEVEAREQGAFLLYRVGLSEQARARAIDALHRDSSPWVRSYMAKALALLGGGEIGPLLVEALDNEATLEAQSRVAEAIALMRDPQLAPTLKNLAEEVWESTLPTTVDDPQEHLRIATACGMFADALCAKLDPSLSNAKLVPGEQPDTWRYTSDSRGSLDLAGGTSYRGFAAKVNAKDMPTLMLPQDSPEALALLK
jgi:hypothetical protein